MSELRVPGRHRRGRYWDEAASVQSGADLLAHVAGILGVPDLRRVDMLDVGCGVKFTQAILNQDIPIQRYVGIDVDADLIAFLDEQVDDRRFEFLHFDASNKRYNPNGTEMRARTRLPVGPAERFDVITLFSVMTHLEPDDYRHMLELLRPHIRPHGRLIFSLYIDERTAEGHGLMDRFATQLGDSAVGRIETFRDLKPAKPLEWAVYSRPYSGELIEGSGWTVESLCDPTPLVQHHYVLRPA